MCSISLFAAPTSGDKYLISPLRSQSTVSFTPGKI
jgi:hypothetical protein